jgi:hypothetical protein
MGISDGRSPNLTSTPCELEVSCQVIDERPPTEDEETTHCTYRWR